jgi:hypothetical protein
MLAGLGLVDFIARRRKLNSSPYPTRRDRPRCGGVCFFKVLHGFPQVSCRTSCTIRGNVPSIPFEPL